MARGNPEDTQTTSKERSYHPRVYSRRGQVFHDEDFHTLIDDDAPPESLIRNPNDEEVCPIPIALVSLNPRYAQEGAQKYIYKPIAGFEHLWNSQDVEKHFQNASQQAAQIIGKSDKSTTHTDICASPRSLPTSQASQGQQALVRIPQASRASASAAGLESKPESQTKPHRLAKRKAKLSRKRSAKRSRSIAELDDGYGEKHSNSEPCIVTVDTKSFFVADMEALKSFLTYRLKELTVNPVKKIATQWIVLAEPERKKMYGKYHKKTPVEMPANAQPPWWPQGVVYFEPSHLHAEDVWPVCVEILLLHRHPDARGKPRINWTERLKKAAVHYVENCDTASYSAAKDDKHSAAMKERALKEILPDMFTAAQAYEDHVAMYGLYNGEVNDDPEAQRGRQHTWRHASKPQRASSSKPKKGNKRLRCEDSGSEAIDEPEDVDGHIKNEDEQNKHLRYKNRSSDTQGSIIPLLEPTSHSNGRGISGERNAQARKAVAVVKPNRKHPSSARTIMPYCSQVASQRPLSIPSTPTTPPVARNGPTPASPTPEMSPIPEQFARRVPFPTPNSSFCQSMNGLELESTGAANKPQPTVGVRPNMQLPPAYGPSPASYVNMPTGWVDDRFYPPSSGLYHSTTTPSSLLDEKYMTQVQPFREESVGVSQHPTTFMGSQESAYYMSGMDQKSGLYPYETSYGIPVNNVIQAGAPHAPYGEVPPDPMMVPPDNSHLSFSPRTPQCYNGLPY